MFKRLIAQKDNMYYYLLHRYGNDFCIDGRDYKVYTNKQMLEQAEYDLYHSMFYSHRNCEPEDLLNEWQQNAANRNLFFDSKQLKQLLTYDIYFIRDIIRSNNLNPDDINLPDVYYDEFMRKQARLKKRAMNVENLSNNIFNNLGRDGRDLLKKIEEYKYSIVQQKELVVDDKSQKQIQKCIDDLDNVSAFIYNFVYDLENYNNVDEYDKRLEFSVPENAEEDIEVEQPEPEIEEEPTEENEEDIDMEDNPFADAEMNDENFDEE